MIYNYIKAALASWYRRKAFTALTLISMAFSVVLIACLGTYWALLHTSLPPETNKESLRIMSPSFYTVKENRKLVWFEVGQQKLMPKSFFEYDLEQLGIEKYTAFSGLVSSVAFIKKNYTQYKLEVTFTDGTFFNIFSFDFLKGKGYSGTIVSPENTPVVITQEIAEKLFGTIECVGENFRDGHSKFVVSGVIKPVAPWSLFYPRDMFMMADLKKRNMVPTVAFRVENENEQIKLNRKLEQLASLYMSSDENHKIELESQNFIKAYAEIKGLNGFFKPSMSIPILIIVFLLPIACMVNLFISMVGERTEELGIRKSFGATAGNITGQFIVESIMMTFVAGIFALGLSIPFWKIFLAVDYDTVTRDIFSWRVFAISILGFTVIGAVVGYFTSIKLAKTSIVRSLGTAQS